MTRTTISGRIDATFTLGSSPQNYSVWVEGSGEVLPTISSDNGILVASSIILSNISNDGEVSGAAGATAQTANGMLQGAGGGIGIDIEGNVDITNSGGVYGGKGGMGATGDGTEGGGGGSGGSGITVNSKAYISNSGSIVGGTGGSGNLGIGIGGGEGGSGGSAIGTSAQLTLRNYGVLIGGAGGNGGGGDAFLGAGGGGGSGGSGGAGGSFSDGSQVVSLGDIIGGSGGEGADGNISGNGGTGGNGGVGVSITGATVLENLGTIYGGNGGSGGQAGIGRLEGRNGAGGAGGVGAYVGGLATLINFGVIIGGSSGQTGGSLSTGDPSSAMDGSLASGVGIYIDGGTFIDRGLVAGNDHASAIEFGSEAGSLIVYDGAQFIGGVTANLAEDDCLEFAGSSTSIMSGIGTAIIDFDTLSFAAGAAWTIEGNFTGLASGQVIDGFDQDDKIILDNVTDISGTYNPQTGLQLLGSEELTLNFRGEPDSVAFSIASNGRNTTISLLGAPPCFAQGTSILTEAGQVRVEDLSVGDRVISPGGGSQEVVWIGRRLLGKRGRSLPHSMQPILFQSNSIGDGLPFADLLLSPDHALYFEQCLIPAKVLTNGFSIRPQHQLSVTYYHIELATHGLIYANGVISESYLNTGNRNQFDNFDSSKVYIPDLPFGSRESLSCAPLVDAGSVVESVRQMILDRAKIETDANPKLRIIRGSQNTIVSSRAAVPGELYADPRDRRKLGVKISALSFDEFALPIDHPDLSVGWYDIEQDGRWTNGRALIPNRITGKFRRFQLTLAATMVYPSNDT